MGNSFKDYLDIVVSTKTKKLLSKSSKRSYRSGINTMSDLYKKRGTIDKDLTNMNYEEFCDAYAKIQKDSEFSNRNKKQGNFDSATLNNYLNYLRIIKATPNIDFKNFSKDSNEIQEIAEEIQESSFTLPERFENYKKFCYSLLAKPFVILAGNSGTGKTKIAKDFATWLGKKDVNDEIFNKLIIPVGSDWTDNTKVLGFYNPIENKYETSKILDFIMLAEEHSEIPFFLILDEMNLSHVERYFSDFLSAMESNEAIILYSKNDEVNCNISETVNIPENLFIIGTVNIDETTYMFSPKVLDRANVIEFIPEQEDVLKNFREDLSPNTISPANDGSAEGFLVLAKKVRESTKLPDGTKKAEEILKEISNILKGSCFEFAFRTTKEIRLYLNAAKKLADNEGNKLEDKDYISLMDEQLIQKILPKIHGNRSQIGELLRKLSEFCETQKQEIAGKEFGLIESKKKIDRMIKQLETSQFASFI